MGRIGQLSMLDAINNLENNGMFGVIIAEIRDDSSDQLLYSSRENAAMNL